MCCQGFHQLIDWPLVVVPPPVDTPVVVVPAIGVVNVNVNVVVDVYPVVCDRELVASLCHRRSRDYMSAFWCSEPVKVAHHRFDVAMK